MKKQEFEEIYKDLDAVMIFLHPTAETKIDRDIAYCKIGYVKAIIKKQLEKYKS